MTGATICKSLKYNTERISLQTKKQAELESKQRTVTASLQKLKKLREQEVDQTKSSSFQQSKQRDETIQQTLVQINIRLQELEVSEHLNF